jgi:hypothetical protein
MLVPVPVHDHDIIAQRTPNQRPLDGPHIRSRVDTKNLPAHFTQRRTPNTPPMSRVTPGASAGAASNNKKRCASIDVEARVAKVVVRENESGTEMAAVPKTVLEVPEPAAVAACKQSLDKLALEAFAPRHVKALLSRLPEPAASAAGSALTAPAPALHLTLTGKTGQTRVVIVNELHPACTATAAPPALVLPPLKGLSQPSAPAPAPAPLGVCVQPLHDVEGVQWQIAAVGDPKLVSQVDYLHTARFTYACVMVPDRASVYVLRILPSGVPMLLAAITPAASFGVAGGVPDAMELVGACLLPSATAAGHEPNQLHLVTTHKGNLVFCTTMLLDVDSPVSMPRNMRLQRVLGTVDEGSDFGDLGRVRCILGTDGMPHLGIVRRHCVTMYDVLCVPGRAKLVRVFRGDDSACVDHAQHPVDFVAASYEALHVVTNKGIIGTYVARPRPDVVLPRMGVVTNVDEDGLPKYTLCEVASLRRIPSLMRSAGAGAGAAAAAAAAAGLDFGAAGTSSVVVYGVANMHESPAATLITTADGRTLLLHSRPEARRPQAFTRAQKSACGPMLVPKAPTADPALSPLDILAYAAAAAAPSPAPASLSAAGRELLAELLTKKPLEPCTLEHAI